MRSLRLPGRITAAIAAAAIFLTWIRCGPLPADLLDERNFTSTTFLDRNGVVLYEPLSLRGDRSEWLDASQLPPNLVDATVAAEDRRFFHHIGIDPIAMLRALLHDLRALRIVEGGSTITQQVSKQLLAARDSRGTRNQEAGTRRGVATKIREAIVALRLEHHLTKRQILALYLNIAPYGEQSSGAVRASRRYFGAPVANLTVAQAAFLAALPQRPSQLDPFRKPAAARLRQLQILDRMRACGFIDETALRQARAERLRLVRENRPAIALHFLDQVRGQLGDSPALRVRTTLDASLQRDVEGIIRAEEKRLLRHGAHSAAVAVLDNRSGEWLAWEGSGDYFGSAFGGAIDGVAARRQPGSALKPFTYALAFEQGLSPATVLPDVPRSFPTAEDGIVYTPQNYDGAYRGPLRARAALAGSENVPAVAALSRIGPPALLRFLRRAGFSDFQKTADYYGLGLTLGDAEVQLQQLIEGYAMFARGGLPVTTTMICNAAECGPAAECGAGLECGAAASAASGRGLGKSGGVELGNSALNPLPDAAESAAPHLKSAAPQLAAGLVSPVTAFWITDILSDAKAREYVFGSGGSLDFPFPVAVKTGTSQAYRDNWVVGYTREVTVGVWVGNFDRTEMRGMSGVTGAGPIFHAVMLAAAGRVHAGDAREEIQVPPSGIALRPICALSGLRPSTACPATEIEWVRTSDPVRFCDWHHAAAGGSWVDWPAEYRGWAGQNGLVRQNRPVQRVARRRESTGIDVISPPRGATYLIDPTLRREFQTLALRATAAAPTVVTWLVDERPVGRTSSESPLQWPLRAGHHTITARDEEGHSDSVTVHVK